MIALLMVITVAVPHIQEGGEAERRLHLQLDAAFTYGIGGQSTLGASAHLTGYTALWNTRHATGSLDVGVELAYGNEPTALAPWFDGNSVEGSVHRIQTLVTLGHSFHLGARRRLAFGIHLFGGWNHWLSAYSVRYPTEGVNASATVERDHFVAGAQVKLGYRFSKHVGIHMVIAAPLPYPSSYVVGMFWVGVGLSFYLR